MIAHRHGVHRGDGTIGWWTSAIATGRDSPTSARRASRGSSAVRIRGIVRPLAGPLAGRDRARTDGRRRGGTRGRRPGEARHPVAVRRQPRGQRRDPRAPLGQLLCRDPGGGGRDRPARLRELSIVHAGPRAVHPRAPLDHVAKRRRRSRWRPGSRCSYRSPRSRTARCRGSRGASCRASRLRSSPCATAVSPPTALRSTSRSARTSGRRWRWSRLLRRAVILARSARATSCCSSSSASPARRSPIRSSSQPLAGVTAHTAATVTALEPVYGIALAALLLGEMPGVRILAGGALIIGAAIAASRRAAAGIGSARAKR